VHSRDHDSMPRGRMSWLSAARALLVTALVSSFAVAVPHAGATGTVSPDRDPFYRYAGAKPLAQIAPGTVLKTRKIRASFGTHRTPVRAEQLLYRTTDQLGAPSVTVTTVLLPKHRRLAPRLVGYLSFYDGLGAKCDPSFTLNGGKADSATEQQSMEEDALINWYLSQGFVVTVPDFEGTGLHWMAARESAFGTLDAIRATESYLRVGPRTPVGLSGYSGGALAADWAAELAPLYAPTLNIAGVAAGGVPVNYWHMFDYINGDKTYSPAIPAMLLGLSRAYRLDLTPYLSSYGVEVMHSLNDICMTAVFGNYGNLTIAKIMKPEYQDLRKVPAIARMLNEQIMGTVPGHPRAPMLLGVGNVDGRGDGVMSAGDVKALAHQYCKEGVTVQYREYKHASHITAGAFFDPQTGPFLQARLAGIPMRGNCRSV
jgi:Secretory lipase